VWQHSVPAEVSDLGYNTLLSCFFRGGKDRVAGTSASTEFARAFQRSIKDILPPRALPQRQISKNAPVPIYEMGIMPTLFLYLLLIGLPSPARVALAAQLPLVHEPTPSQWIVISLITLSTLAIFLRIKLG
jgi:hypothetical protein